MSNTKRPQYSTALYCTVRTVRAVGPFLAVDGARAVSENVEVRVMLSTFSFASRLEERRFFALSAGASCVSVTSVGVTAALGLALA